MPSKIQNYISKTQQEEILEAILAAEKNCSGEIRVHIEKQNKLDPLKRAWQVFTKLKMQETKDRNGILFYLAFESRQFAVIGDEGIHKVVGDEFWQKIKDAAINHFKQGEFVEGLVEGIKEAGASLKKHFPYSSSDKNELKDDISFE